MGEGNVKSLRQRKGGWGFPRQGLKLDQMQRTMDLKDLRKGRGGGSLVVRPEGSLQLLAEPWASSGFNVYKNYPMAGTPATGKISCVHYNTLTQTTLLFVIWDQDQANGFYTLFHPILTISYREDNYSIPRPSLKMKE